MHGNAKQFLETIFEFEKSTSLILSIPASSAPVCDQTTWYNSHRRKSVSYFNWKKFRGQTSDNTETWHAEMGRVRDEKKRRKKIKEEQVRRKKIQVREKVGKSWNIWFFQWFVAPEGRIVGSLKRRVRSQQRWKSARPCSAKHISKSKCAKCTEGRAIFGSWNVEKVLVVLARRAFWTENIQSTPMSDHFWRLRLPKNARRCGGNHVYKSKCANQPMFGPLLEVEMSKKCKPLWRAAHVDVKGAKNRPAQPTVGGSDVLFAWQAQGVMHLVK